MKWWEWVFSGVGVLALALFIEWLRRRSRSSPQSASITAQDAKVVDSPVASGTGIIQTVNSPTINVSLPAPAPGSPGNERYNEWRELIDEIHESIVRMGYAFMPLVPVKAGDDRNDYQAGIRRGNRVLGNRILIADAIQKSELKKDWDELVQYAHSGRGPRDRWEQGTPTMGGFDAKAREFQEKLMRIARQDMTASVFAVPENQQSAAWPERHGEFIATSSETIPLFPTTLGGFRPAEENKDFWNKPFPVRGWIRLFEGNDWEGIPNFPHTMNGCSHGVFMIRWRSAHPDTLARSSVRYSSKSEGDEKIGAFGYMSGTNCEQPMFKIVATPNRHTLVDLFYELKFWQAAP